MTSFQPNEKCEVVYENRYQKVWRVLAILDGLTKEYFITDYGQRAGLVVVRGTEVLLVRQNRLLIKRPSWEIPGGKVDDGETPEEAAIRECLEETGIRGHNPKSLLAYQPGLDSLHNPTFLFYVTEYENVGADAVHTQEVYEHQWLPLRQTLEMIASGLIVDSFTILALLSYSTWITDSDQKHPTN